MAYDAVFGTPPGSGGGAIVPSPSSAANGLDENALVEYACSPNSNGWVPLGGSVLLKNAQLALAAEPTSQTYTALRSGLYQVSAYEISTVATSGTMPQITATYLDADTGGSVTATVVAVSGTISAANTVNQGSVVVNVKAGGTIVIAGASYTTTTYNLKLRVTFLG